MPTINLTAYKFITLEKVATLREDLEAKCLDLGVRGTVLLGEEGINVMVAGTREGVDGFMGYLREDPRFSELEFKESVSEEIPFERLKVKIKPEIVTMGVPHIAPETQPAPYITAEQLKQWYDDGKEMLVLDTRNEFEVDLGTFAGVTHLNIEHFREFPEAVKALPDEVKAKPVVTFCTGGIRCEKAAPLMIEAGFKEVYQLEGGILKYFEECGSAHYEGACFVFDERVTITPESVT